MLYEELARALYVLGDPTASLQAYRDAVAIIPAEPPTAERARAISGLGQILMLLARYDESRVLCEDAARIARAVGARAQEGHALSTLGLDLAVLGDPAGTEVIEQAIAIAREVRNADDIGRGYVNLAEALNLAGDTRRASEVTAEGLRAADEIGINMSYGHYIRAGGIAFEYLIGEWARARRMLDETLTRTPSGSGPEAYRLGNSLPFIVGSGSFDEADEGIERGLELIRHVIGAQFSGPIHAAAVERELWRHDPRAALDLRRSGHGAPGRHGGLDGDLAPVPGRRVGGGRPGRSRTSREGRVGRHRGRHAHRRPPGGVRPVVRGGPHRRSGPLVGGRSREPGGRGDAGPRRVGPGGLVRRRPSSGPPAIVRTSRPSPVGARRRRASPPAIAPAPGRPCVRRMPSRPGSEPGRCSRRSRRSPGGPGSRSRIDDADEPPTPAEIDRYGLTPRELEVLALLADGRTNRQIAETLFISESTAGVHVSNILGKLGATNRVEAAAMAYRMGATTDPAA